MRRTVASSTSAGPDQAAQPDVDRPAEEEGEDALDQHVADDEDADVGVDPEHRLDRAEAELGGEGEDRAEQRRDQAAVDLEALAEQPGRVADRDQHQRGAAERLDQQAVEQEADREAGDGAGQAAAEQAEADDQRGQHVGADVEELDLGEEGELQEDAEQPDDDQAGDDFRGEDHLRLPPVSTWTVSRLRRSA